MMRRYFLAVVAGLFLVLAASQTSLAAKDDKYPSKTITWLINAAPGGGFDLHSRAVARVMRKKLGVNIIIRNVPGAGGVISWNLLTVAKPDGYTIGIVNLPGAIVSQLFKEDAVQAQGVQLDRPHLRGAVYLRRGKAVRAPYARGLP